MGVHPESKTYRQPPKFFGAIRGDLPENFDSREKWSKCPSIAEIRDQGSCGSCWAVAATAAMTDRVSLFSCVLLSIYRGKNRFFFHYSNSNYFPPFLFNTYLVVCSTTNSNASPATANRISIIHRMIWLLVVILAVSAAMGKLNRGILLDGY